MAKNDICNAFPGYEYVNGKNMFRGEDVGKGGYVYSEPGIYEDVALLDVASMHPHSITAMNCFGEYTQNFKDLMDARIYIKRREFDKAKKLFNGKLAPYLEDESKADQLAQALKIAINSVYGLTSASFSNPFRDKRNVNNIVALRGALFMVTLRDEVQKLGYTVVHIKTDSIKIANADIDIINFCMEFAKKYGYEFEHEATYDKICLIDKAQYIARYATVERCCDIYGEEYVNSSKSTVKECKKHGGQWTATGAEFQRPYIFKTMFSNEEITFEDMCETKEVKTSIYLDMNEKLPEGEHNYIFVGRVGSFCPIKEGAEGGLLVREAEKEVVIESAALDGSSEKVTEKQIKYDAVTGTKGYRWLEAETVKSLGMEKKIDKGYFKQQVEEAMKAIENCRVNGDGEPGDYYTLILPNDPVCKNERNYSAEKKMILAEWPPPWKLPCGEQKYETCFDCDKFDTDTYRCSIGYNLNDSIFVKHCDISETRGKHEECKNCPMTIVGNDCHEWPF